MICARCLARNFVDRENPLDQHVPAAVTVYAGEAMCLADWLTAWDNDLKPVHVDPLVYKRPAGTDAA